MKTTGVYKITYLNDPSLFYIGSSSFCLKRRLAEHRCRLRKNQHHSKYMQNIFNKHGENIFSYEIIENCLPKDCLIREQYWIDTLKPKFNTLPTAGSQLGSKKSNECKKKILWWSSF